MRPHHQQRHALLIAAALPATLIAASSDGGTSLPGGGFNCSSACYDPSRTTEFYECTASCSAHDPSTLLLKLLAALFLVVMSGMFSGLTLGLLSLSIEGLDIIINGSDDEEERRWARAIMPLRRRGNLLLCTLLLGNTLVNAVLSILTADITGGGLSGLIIVTAVIVVFGEISPQAVCSRHGLRIGASLTWIVRPLMVVMLPVTYPIASVLDCFLGREMGNQYNRQQLDKLLQMHATDQAITSDDQKLLSSALRFSSKIVAEIMTPLGDNFMISVTDNLDFDLLKAIYVSGYTRIPVFHNRRDCIVGIVYTKDLILVDPNDEIPVASILPFCSRAINAVPKGTGLEKLLAEMQSSRSHLFYVTAEMAGPPRKKVAKVKDVVGIVTMEDLLEELISIELIDEDDTVTDNISRKKVVDSSRARRRIEFFDMMQRRELMQQASRGTDDGRLGGERPTVDEVRALASYLSNNVAAFRPPNMTGPTLRKLLTRCSINVVTEEQVDSGRFVYVRGVPAGFCCLLLHGRLQIRAGNEGFTSEIGPWTTLATQALSDPNYVPDFTARVECSARILIISRAEVLTVFGIVAAASPPPPLHGDRESAARAAAGGGATWTVDARERVASGDRELDLLDGHIEWDVAAAPPSVRPASSGAFGRPQSARMPRPASADELERSGAASGRTGRNRVPPSSDTNMLGL